MDLRLTLLLICLCSGGAINSEVTKQPVLSTTIDLPPPDHPTEKTENETSSESNNVNATEAPTLAATTPVTSRPNVSSEEEPGEDCASVGRSSQSNESIARAIQKLGLQLLQNLVATPEQPNVIISPLSISLALSQLALGAAGETEELLMHHLHGNILPCYHQSLRNVLQGLKNNDLQIATRIFMRQGFVLKPDFIRESLQAYESEPAALQSLQQINDWVANATKGMMTNFLSALPPNILLMLINAVHFKGAWKAQFDPKFTSKGLFSIDEKHTVEVDTMEHSKYPLSLYFDNELDAQVARFPFLKSMSLIVVMPTSGRVNMSSLSAELNISNIYNHLPKENPVHVKVPKFKLQYTQELTDVLTKLGLGMLFTHPNLSRLGDGLLMVSKVHHKSSMEINEEGAEAAAATAVSIIRISSPSFHLTQPFFFALMDDVTQVPVFMGVITNPNPDAPTLQKAESGSKEGYMIDKKTGIPPK